MRLSRLVPALVLFSVGLSTVARAQTFVEDRPARAVEVQYLAGQGFGSGNWRIDAWGVSPAQDYRTIQAPSPAARCHYVFDVPLDCDLIVASR